MPIIRKKLTEAELGSPRYRYDATEDVFEYQLPDLSWVEDPAYPDPRVTNVVPPRTGGDPRCDAAASLANWIEEFITRVVNDLTIGIGAFGIAGTAIALLSKAVGIAFGGFGLLWVLAVDLGLGLVSEGFAVLGAAFTSGVYETLNCIFYCRMDETGFIDASALDVINADVGDQIGGVPAVILSLMFSLMGFAGMNTQGALGDATGDCDECECENCIIWDFRTGTHGATINGGTQVGGQGIVGANFGGTSLSDATITLAFPDVYVNQVNVSYTKGGGSGSNNANNVLIRRDGSTVQSDGSNALGTNIGKTLFPNQIVDGVIWDLNSGTDPTPVTIHQVVVYYTGAVITGQGEVC